MTRWEAVIPRKKTVTWILVADGARARILTNEGPGMGLASVVDREFVGNNAPTREIGTDKPGRAFESADGSRHAMEPRVDWHRFEKSQFAKRMADILEKAATRQAFDRLVLVAPPQTLGDLRAALGRQARDRLSAELNKDLTQVGIHDLPPYLSAIMRL